MDPLTTTKCLSRPWDAKYKYEKTVSRGTWAFHSVDGWYLSTSPEHYRTHRCHIKATNSDRFSNTVVFQHKTITNPTITPADTLMQAIADCTSALHGITSPSRDITHLRQLLGATTTTLTSPTPNNIGATAPQATPLPDLPDVPRVPPSLDTPALRITRTMTNAPMAAVPPPATVPNLAPNDDNSRHLPPPHLVLLPKTLVPKQLHWPNSQPLQH